MISIIIPVYNAENFLCSTVDSILSQNSLDYECCDFLEIGGYGNAWAQRYRDAFWKAQTVFIPNGVAHIVVNNSDKNFILLAYTDKLYDPADTIAFKIM